MMPVATLSPCLINSGIVSSRDFTALLPTVNETVTTRKHQRQAESGNQMHPLNARRSARSAYPSAFWLSIGMNIPR